MAPQDGTNKKMLLLRRNLKNRKDFDQERKQELLTEATSENLAQQTSIDCFNKPINDGQSMFM